MDIVICKNVKTLSHNSHKNKLKWIIDLSVRAKMFKVLEENVGENLYDLGLGKEFLHPTAQSIKEKLDKLYIIIKT